MIGGKCHDAALLSVSETARVARALAYMGKAIAAEGDFEGVAAALEAMTQVLFNALQKTNSPITAELLEAATPNEVMAAIGVLIPASCDPSTLAGQLLNAYQARGLEEN
jgi:hypothetical protein